MKRKGLRFLQIMHTKERTVGKEMCVVRKSWNEKELKMSPAGGEMCHEELHVHDADELTVLDPPAPMNLQSECN